MGPLDIVQLHTELRLLVAAASCSCRGRGTACTAVCSAAVASCAAGERLCLGCTVEEPQQGKARLGGTTATEHTWNMLQQAAHDSLGPLQDKALKLLQPDML